MNDRSALRWPLRAIALCAAVVVAVMCVSVTLRGRNISSTPRDRALLASKRSNGENAAGTDLFDPMVIPLGNMQKAAGVGKFARSFRYIFQQMNDLYSNLIVYPFPFMHNETDPIPGGVFRIKPPSYTTEDWQDYINRLKYQYLALYERHIVLEKAKALYDDNIAIFRSYGKVQGQERDITYESTYFCDALHSWMGKYAFCHPSISAWQKYKESPAAERTSVVYVSPAEVRSGDLVGPYAVNFGMLFIPDHISGNEALILEQLGEDGLVALKEFVKQGGTVYSSGKSAVILEEAGLLAEGVVDSNKFLQPRLGSTVYSRPCGGSLEKSWEENMICMGLITDEVGPYNVLLSAFRLDVAKDPSLSTLVEFDTSHSELVFVQRKGHERTEISMETIVPMFLFKNVGTKGGQVLINQAHSLTRDETTFPIVLNSVMLALSRPVLATDRCAHDLHFTSDLSPDYFPGNEAGIALDAAYDVRNLYVESVSDAKLRVAIHKGYALRSVPESCVAISMEYMFPIADRNDYEYLFDCYLGTMSALDHQSLIFNVEIVDASVTRVATQIPISYAEFSYTYQEHLFVVELQYCLIQAYQAARLVGDYNLNPSGLHPLPGEGDDIDCNIAIYNKENTAALDVTTVVVVPLVTPVFDADAQDSFAHPLVFWKDYYDQALNQIADYNYPLTDDTDYDYLDFHVLANESVCLVAEWGDPVALNTVNRKDLPQLAVSYAQVDMSRITNVRYSYDVDTANEVLAQRGYVRAPELFEHAQPRLFAFTDPADDPAEKREILLMRNDIHFRQNGDVPLPDGVENASVVISIDRFPLSRGQAPTNSTPAEMVHDGYFSRAAGGLDPDVYWNDLMQGSGSEGTIEVHYEDVGTMFSGDVVKTHYLVPVESSIHSSDDLLYFEDGYLKYPYPSEFGKPPTEKMEYPEVSLVTVWTGACEVLPDDSYLGGKVDIVLPPWMTFLSASPLDDDRVTVAAEHIAIREKSWDANTWTLSFTFRRGGNSYERTSPSTIAVSVEGVQPTTHVNATVSVEVSSLSFDFALATATHGQQFDVYTPSATMDMVLKPKPMLRLPAVKLTFTDVTSEGYGMYGRISAYNRLKPATRYGMFFQEMLHRQLYGIDEAHHLASPGVSTKSKGFSGIATLGTGSIPYAQFVSTGSAQLIPFAPETSRYEWHDIWGRTFSQPVRSTFVDSSVPWEPKGGSERGMHQRRIIRNFMMTSTHELLDRITGNRILEWSTDVAVDVHVMVKLLNNYPRYFDPTMCPGNEVYRCGSDGSRVFDLEYPDAKSGSGMFHTEGTSQESWVSNAHYATYGECWHDDGTVLGGVTLDLATREAIANTSVCPGSDPDCAGVVPVPGVTLSRRAKSEPKVGTDWNYSPAVDNAYPVGYVEAQGNTYANGMWDLRDELYADTWYHKGYPWHMDNHLPSLDNTLKKPENLLEFPVFKGFGFFVSYDRSYQNPRFGAKAGWWSDSLQSRDSSLLAGQASSPVLSTIATPEVTPLDFVALRDLTGCSADNSSVQPPSLENWRAERGSSFFTCMFNQHRLMLDPEDLRSETLMYPQNVYTNYIVPVPVDKNPDVGMDCSSKAVEAYTPETIHEYAGNYEDMGTRSALDYMYFAAGLRGGAKETLNVLLKMDPPPECENPRLVRFHYEGSAKVYEGGRFVYRNPANGPNSFTIVNEEPAVVAAKSVDITVQNEVIPTTTTTFCSEFYMLTTLEDPAEKSRRFIGPYLNEYGFGDFVTKVYVGDANTDAVVQAGGALVIRVELVNNAGFDIRLVKGAIEAASLNDSALGDHDPLSLLAPDVQAPTAYNFLTLEIPSALNGSVASIVPSLHLANVNPIFFDFLGVNPTVIRDGFRGSFYFRVTLKSSLPTPVLGHVFDFPVKLHTEYFDAVPGQVDGWNKDPSLPEAAGWHDYELAVPAARMGIAHPSNRNRAYFVSGRAHDLQVNAVLQAGVRAHKALLITYSQLNAFRSKSILGVQAMSDYFETLKATQQDVPFESHPIDRCPVDERELISGGSNQCGNEQFGIGCGRSTFWVNLTRAGILEFPVPRSETGYYDTATLYILTQMRGGNLPFGTLEVGSDLSLNYTDFDERGKYSTDHLAVEKYTIEARGAALVTSFDATFVDSGTLLPIPDTFLIPNRTNTLKIDFQAENAGSNIAFNMKLEVVLGKNVSVNVGELQLEVPKFDVTPLTGNETGRSLLKMEYDTSVEPGSALYKSFYVSVFVGAESEEPTVDDSSVIDYSTEPLPPGPSPGPESKDHDDVWPHSAMEDDASSSEDGQTFVLIAGAATIFDLTTIPGDQEVHQPLPESINLSYSTRPSSVCPLKLWIDKVSASPRYKLLVEVLEGCPYEIDDITFRYVRMTDWSQNWIVLTETTNLEVFDDPDHASSVQYRVMMMRQPDPASLTFQVGMSDVENDNSTSSFPWGQILLLCLLVMFIGVLIVGILHFVGVVSVGLLGQRQYQRWGKPHKSQGKGEVDKILASELNKIYWKTGMCYKFKFGVVADGEGVSEEESGALYTHHGMTVKISQAIQSKNEKLELTMSSGSRTGLRSYLKKAPYIALEECPAPLSRSLYNVYVNWVKEKAQLNPQDILDRYAPSKGFSAMDDSWRSLFRKSGVDQKVLSDPYLARPLALTLHGMLSEFVESRPAEESLTHPLESEPRMFFHTGMDEEEEAE